MSTERKTLFREWGQFIAHLIVAGTVAFFALYVKHTVQAELVNFVPKSDFVAYQAAHKDWSVEVLKNLDFQLAGIRDDVKDIKRDLRDARLGINVREAGLFNNRTNKL